MTMYHLWVNSVYDNEYIICSYKTFEDAMHALNAYIRVLEYNAIETDRTVSDYINSMTICDDDGNKLYEFVS